MEYVVNREWLMEQLANKDIKIVDCRFSLSKPDEGERLYKAGHIPGAYYFDLEQQLSAPVSKHGGRHPLPNIEQFRREIEQAGIDNTKTVVAYDGGEGGVRIPVLVAAYIYRTRQSLRVKWRL